MVTAVQVKENRNDNGANPDTFYAVGEATALADNLDSVSTFLAPGQAASVVTPAQLTVTNRQQTTVQTPGAANGQPVGISEIADPTNAFCTAGLTCFGQAAIVSVNYGTAVRPTSSGGWTGMPRCSRRGTTSARAASCTSRTTAGLS